VAQEENIMKVEVRLDLITLVPESHLENDLLLRWSSEHQVFISGLTTHEQASDTWTGRDRGVAVRMLALRFWPKDESQGRSDALL
jgi:hypothetical protein